MSSLSSNTRRISSDEFAPKGEGLSALVLVAGLAVGISAERKAAAMREYSIGGGLGIAVGDMGTGSSQRYIDAESQKLAAEKPLTFPVVLPPPYASATPQVDPSIDLSELSVPPLHRSDRR